jgi:hypothetical protein
VLPALATLTFTMIAGTAALQSHHHVYGGFFAGPAGAGVGWGWCCVIHDRLLLALQPVWAARMDSLPPRDRSVGTGVDTVNRAVKGNVNP